MQRAARLLGGAAAFRAEADAAAPQSFLGRHVDADRAAIRDALGEATFAAEWAAGKRTPTDRVVAFALGEDALAARIAPEWRTITDTRSITPLLRGATACSGSGTQLSLRLTV